MIEGVREAELRAIDALRTGLDLGLAHIDTAEMYGGGRAEELVGQAISGRRGEVFLVSKVLPSNASYEGTLRACERSLKRLCSEHLDLYLLHWESPYPIAETMRAMEKLVDDGLTQFIGVSNFDVHQVKEAQAVLRNHRLAANQVLYHLGERGIERKLIPYCQQHEIAVVGYSPFGQGIFPHPNSRGGKVLAKIARHHGRSVRQVTLNFLTRLPQLFTIPKAGDPDHTRENAGGGGWSLTGEDLSAIDRAFPVPAKDTPLAML
jgi:diketogulonate reductase-like aldo/keto reductase